MVQLQNLYFGFSETSAQYIDVEHKSKGGISTKKTYWKRVSSVEAESST